MLINVAYSSNELEIMELDNLRSIFSVDVGPIMERCRSFSSFFYILSDTPVSTELSEFSFPCDISVTYEYDDIGLHTFDYHKYVEFIPCNSSYGCLDIEQTPDPFDDNSSLLLLPLNGEVEDLSRNHPVVWHADGFVDGWFNLAMDFGASKTTSNFIKVSNLDIPQNISFSCWINIPVDAQDFTVCSLSDTKNSSRLCFRVIGDSQVGVTVDGVEHLIDIPPLNRDKWVFVALSIGESYSRIYIDDDFWDIESSVLSNPTTGEGILYIGQKQTSYGGGLDARESLVGAVDQVRMFGRALKYDEVIILAEEKKINDQGS